MEQLLGFDSTEESVSDIHVLQREEHCRYLGIQVGQTPSNASNWSKCIQALRVRLRLARLKTHSVAQRAAIASAVIIPKVLYVARHSWPSTAIVNQLHDLVKQFVWGSRNGKPAKPWMKEEQAELKKMNGGLSVPNIRTELMTMSATAVSKWAITTSHIDQVIGKSCCTTQGLLRRTSRRSMQFQGGHSSFVITCGQLAQHCVRRSILDPMSPENVIMLPGIIAEGRKLRGTFCAEWLPYMTSTADGWLLDSNGSPYKLAHTSLSVGTAQLGDILRWEWIRPGVLNFIPTCGISGFSRPSIRALERLCATLVSNFPQLLYRPQQTNVLRLYNGQRHYNHEWHLHTSEATLTHVDTTLVKATHTVHSAMDCDIMATRDLNGQKVSFHAHPRFTRIVQLWGGNGRYNTTRSFYRQQVAAARTQIGKDTRDAAVNKAVQTAGSLWPGLQLIQWSELHNIPGIAVYTAQTLLRLKANRLSICPLFCSTSILGVSESQTGVDYVYALWAKIGITPGHDPATWIFSLDLPDTPKRAWTTIKRHIIGHRFSNEHQDHLYSVAHMLWRYMSASLIHAIWCAHLRRMDSDPIELTAEMAIMMTRLEAGMRNLTRLAEAQAGDSDGHTVATVLKAYVDCFLSQTDAIPFRLIWAARMAYSMKDRPPTFADHFNLFLVQAGPGDWTDSFFDLSKLAYATQEAPAVYADGFYGPSHSSYYEQYGCVVLFAEGIGATGVIAMLEELFLSAKRYSAGTDVDGTHTQVWFLWVCQDVCLFHEFEPLLMEIRAWDPSEKHFRLRLFLTKVPTLQEIKYTCPPPCNFVLSGGKGKNKDDEDCGRQGHVVDMEAGEKKQWPSQNKSGCFGFRSQPFHAALATPLLKVLGLIIVVTTTVAFAVHVEWQDHVHGSGIFGGDAEEEDGMFRPLHRIACVVVILLGCFSVCVVIGYEELGRWVQRKRNASSRPRQQTYDLECDRQAPSSTLSDPTTSTRTAWTEMNSLRSNPQPLAMPPSTARTTEMAEPDILEKLHIVSLDPDLDKFMASVAKCYYAYAAEPVGVFACGSPAFVTMSEAAVEAAKELDGQTTYYFHRMDFHD
ncbi:hypothetical protein FI667_g6021, partial [Globisporangium splendens]